MGWKMWFSVFDFISVSHILPILNVIYRHRLMKPLTASILLCHFPLLLQVLPVNPREGMDSTIRLKDRVFPLQLNLHAGRIGNNINKSTFFLLSALLKQQRSCYQSRRDNSGQKVETRRRRRLKGRKPGSISAEFAAKDASKYIMMIPHFQALSNSTGSQPPRQPEAKRT